MAKFKIANHIFDGKPSFMPLNYERGIGVVIPSDTPVDVISELQNATLLEILDQKTEEVVGSYKLIEWRSYEKVYYNNHHGIALEWTTINNDDILKLQKRVDELETANAFLSDENQTLTDALLELAEIIGGES